MRCLCEQEKREKRGMFPYGCCSQFPLHMCVCVSASHFFSHFTFIAVWLFCTLEKSLLNYRRMLHCVPTPFSFFFPFNWIIAYSIKYFAAYVKCFSINQTGSHAIWFTCNDVDMMRIYSTDISSSTSSNRSNIYTYAKWNKKKINKESEYFRRLIEITIKMENCLLHLYGSLIVAYFLFFIRISLACDRLLDMIHVLLRLQFNN